MSILQAARIRFFLGPILLVLAAPLLAAIRGEVVTYKTADMTMKGYVVYDDSTNIKRPGILVIHDWWGHSDFVRGEARKLAKEGYVALAVDLYGDGQQAPDPETAGKLAHSLFDHHETWMARFDAAREHLSNHPMVEPGSIAAVGYSLGGATVLEAARQGSPISAVVSYYGKLTTDHPAPNGTVKAKILVIQPANDLIFPATQIIQFMKEMDAAGAIYRVVNYPGAKHLFNRPDAGKYASKFNMPVAYDANTDQLAWSEMVKFFSDVFK